MRGDPMLAVVSPVPVMRTAAGRVTLTRKFLEGMVEHVRLWPGGRVRVIVEASSNAGNNLDNIEVEAAALPFELVTCGFEVDAIQPYLADVTVAMLMLYHRQAHLSRLCRDLGVRSVYVSEYTLRTRRQINHSGEAGLPKALAKDLLETWRERGLRAAIRAADGLQCNGTPTFDAYQAINPAPMLFFDTRVTEEIAAAEDAVERRFAARRSRQSLHLAFSGRLIAMKGADHLVAVACRLRDLDVPFKLSICGAGVLEDAMRTEAGARGVADKIVFRGALDFTSELVPLMRDEVDLFVCCHVQGDPSCTYLETMACGVPIAGYDNEAFAGLVRVSDVGWLSPLGDPAALADRIAALDDHAIEDSSRRSLRFARQHLFEGEFRRRMDHLATIAAAR